MVRQRICVVGGGVIGLPCAVRLLEELKEVEVTIISEEFSPYTTGDGSAGWIRPYLPGKTEPALVNRWYRETYDHLDKLRHSPDGGVLGIYSILGYDIYKKPLQDPSWKNEVMGFRKISNAELQQFGSEYLYGFTYTTLMTECKKYLPWMMNRFQELGGVRIQRKLKHLRELYGQYDIVVNCTGVGAKELLGDDQLQPLKGQLIKVEAPWIKHVVNAEDDDLYIIPCADSVALGGTHEEGVWSTTINPDQRKRIWEGCCRLIPSLQRARVIEEWAGFRPGRTAIRLETELLDTGGNRILPVVHNYGHGGSGVTLHWGCAGDSVKLVNSLRLHHAKL